MLLVAIAACADCASTAPRTANAAIQENHLSEPVGTGRGTGTIIPFSGAQAIAQNDGTSPLTGSFTNIGFPTIDSKTLYDDTTLGATEWLPGTLTGGGELASVDATTAPTYGTGDFSCDVYTEHANANADTYGSGNESIEDVVRTDLSTVQDSHSRPLVIDFGFAPLNLNVLHAHPYTQAQDYVTSTCG